MDQPTKNKNHVIDPDGEVMFLLGNANAPFAVWDEKKIGKPTPKKAVKKPPKKKAKLDSAKVSAKHLMLASPVLKKTLSGGWKESEIFAKKGSIDLVVEDWDLDAFLLFLRILHCQHHDLPSSVTLEMLAKIAVMADYYACKNTVAFFANLWIEKLEPAFPTEYSRDLMLWLFVSCFFDKRELFAKSASIAMTKCNAPITNLGLPIPINVLSKSFSDVLASSFIDILYQDRINIDREWYIQHVMKRLKEQRDLYLSKDWSCSLDCCSMLLGALEKQMHLNGLSLPGPQPPFYGISYETLVTAVHSFTIPRWAPISDLTGRYNTEHYCEETRRGYNLLEFKTVCESLLRNW
ncbi:conserved hypothetical protein [Talaromyces stipitatus ATCC 10500]|uniref:BTB domain-containing protein n=1 Tax=Talaromyces stipitatus (strain ATCC 10500 / CBS 375.48 / QM 6759 / NRRL 1006) TaxID=441959 RepID=B8MAZ7_TALSN|nr:uncharacterized protein TSTA_124250 [Talaromyces stipitatus ATCC 10500]EED18697.1 conserved hypothetical protein [Talaromyces stipitatus ATCC 10500]